MRLLKDGMMPSTSALDWSTFTPTFLDGDPAFDEWLSASHDTAHVASGSS